MNIRPFNLETDLPTLHRWWDGHKALRVPDLFLHGTLGFIVVDGPVEVAAAFLYLGKDCQFGVIEYITTNPAVARSKTSLQAVYALLFHVEHVATQHGCLSLLSMVAPGSSEERIMGKLGYVTSSGVSHRMWGKDLVTKEGA